MKSFLVLMVFLAIAMAELSKDSCSNVYVNQCQMLSCIPKSDNNVPLPSICQVMCSKNEYCSSWRYEKSSQVFLFIGQPACELTTLLKERDKSDLTELSGGRRPK